MRVEIVTPTASTTPTIRGVFVNSHIDAVRRRLGARGVEELRRRFGAPISFGPGQNVPVRDEIRLIEVALDLLNNGPVDPQTRAREAGRLHFRNFTTTPWAKVIFALFPRNLRFMMLHCATVAERVFDGVTFETNALDDNRVAVRMGNADYPMDHFLGLFEEWMDYFGEIGRVEARQLRPHEYEYLFTWGVAP